MNNKKIAVIIGVVIIVLLIAWGFYAMYKSADETAAPVGQENIIDDEYVATINVRHQYKNGTHTYAGTVDVPTPCEQLTSKAVKNPADVKKVALEFTTTKTTQGACAQVITSRAFKVSFTGDATVNLNGTLNGKKVRLNVFEVPANENLDDYDTDIKG